SLLQAPDAPDSTTAGVRPRSDSRSSVDLLVSNNNNLWQHPQQSSDKVGGTSMLVKLLEHPPHQTPTLPTSIANSPLDKLANENKNRPDQQPVVTTGLAEMLSSRQRPTPAQRHYAPNTQPQPQLQRYERSFDSIEIRLE
uniref:Uncharacterized protein n=1 Tax=Plectus sambesii TaxID=2011161 RepID=A0A914XL47_9BILA